jgi:hypothetical protein
MNIWLGADVFYGDPDGFYGQFDDEDLVTVGFDWGFYAFVNNSLTAINCSSFVSPQVGNDTKYIRARGRMARVLICFFNFKFVSNEPSLVG